MHKQKQLSQASPHLFCPTTTGPHPCHPAHLTTKNDRTDNGQTGSPCLDKAVGRASAREGRYLLKQGNPTAGAARQNREPCTHPFSRPCGMTSNVTRNETESSAEEKTSELANRC